HLRYALSPRVAIVGEAEGGEDIHQLGAELVVNALETGSISLAGGLGAHVRTFVTDFYPRWFAMAGLDATGIVGIHASSRVHLYGAARASFEAANVDLVRGTTPVHLGRFTRFNVIPGFDIGTKQGFDVVGEVAGRLNDRSIGYIAVGL